MFPEMPPKFAIVDSNMLSALGLETLLEIIMPGISIRVFLKFEDLPQEEFAHYFVSARIYFEHTEYFQSKPRRVIVLSNGENLSRLTGMPILNVGQNESDLTHQLLQLRDRGHRKEDCTLQKKEDSLSPREQEVLILIVRGMLNKEIADELGIGLTTVISHRKNIMQKLGIHSVSGLTIYAIMNGIIGVDEI